MSRAPGLARRASAAGAVAAAVVAATSCGPAQRGPMPLRMWTEHYEFRVTADPSPPRAGEPTLYRVVVLDLALFSDFAQRAGMKGIQEWLSFYYKSPMTAPGLQPEHDLFIQQTKLKNTLRHLMGEEQITHLGLEYYQDQ